MTITGGLIKDNGTEAVAAADDGITFGGTVSQIVITGGMVVDTQTVKTQEYGINFAIGTSISEVIVQQMIVTGNSISGLTGTPGGEYLIGSSAHVHNIGE